MHTVVPLVELTEYVPVEQKEQVPTGVEVENLPDSQEVQAPAPEPEYLPMSQSVHTVAPALDNLPGEQDPQIVLPGKA